MRWNHPDKTIIADMENSEIMFFFSFFSAVGRSFHICWVDDRFSAGR